ncbi:MAG: DUF502 domain-containing protein [Candidatus Omnitrophica bacterium]|nr:DUF502 domain-containing protein [Candidatus Omnitrophota bacterium]MCM8788923.1 DUF502 domain-containing protein [Candidatus Omnitrophota bacterium]
MRLKNYFISGTLVIVPAALSLWILWKIFVFLESLIGLWIQKAIPHFYVKGLGFISLIAIILILGFSAQNIFGRKILRYIEKVFISVPIFNRLYQFVHSILQQILRKEKQVFREVVLINLAPGVSTIGFVTSKESIIENHESEHWTVFVPTVPNPTTGLVLVIHRDRIKVLPITVEQGMKVLLSFGIFNVSDASSQSKSDNSKKN